MGMSGDKQELYLYKTLISDNGIDKVYRPVLQKEEYERRKRQLEKACVRLINEQDRIQSRGRAET
jgi:hypothetical protein